MKTRLKGAIRGSPLVLFWICFASSISASSQQVDPFYFQAFEKAQKAFLAKDYPSAVRDFEIAVFGLAKDKKLEVKAYVYLGLSYYYLKNTKACENNLREASELMGEESFDSLDIQEEAWPDLNMLLGYFNLRPTRNEEISKKDVEKPKEKGSEGNINRKDASAQEASQVPIQAGELKINEIKEGDTIPLELVDSPPVVIKSVKAILPSWARSQGVKGSVIINALISDKGKVIKTKILRGIKGAFGFNQAAAGAVQQWKFKPATVKGKKVKVWMQITVNFGQQE